MIREILVPVDGSEHSRTALEFACELCKKFDAGLHVVHVIKDEAAEKVVMVLGSASMTLPASPESVTAAGKAVIDATRQFVEEKGCRLSAADAVAGSPAKEILAYAEKSAIDTIVMGSRGLSDAVGLLLGSVSHKVSHLASCTCIVVR